MFLCALRPYLYPPCYGKTRVLRGGHKFFFLLSGRDPFGMNPNVASNVHPIASLHRFIKMR